MFKWFKKKEDPMPAVAIPTPVQYIPPVRETAQVCRVHFHITNDVIIVPYFITYYGTPPRFSSINELLTTALARFRDDNDLGYLLNNRFYPNHVLTKVEVSDIDRQYVQV